MATYIPQVQAYVPQYQPFQPDFNFYSSALQMKQSQYDAAHKQLSTLYGSLLNSPLTRDSNVERKDKIFNMINQDIKKISAMDLSLEQNVTAARKVFDPIYQDDNLIKDMTWTKNYMNALQRADSFKGCTDPKKCGGQYWDTGVDYLNYKREEFRNASDADALSFEDVSYTPYVNVHQKAVDLAKEAGLNVTQDFNTGDWIVTKQNGDLVQGGLYNLFTNTLGSDPNIQAMYDAGAYVKRKSYVNEKVSEGMNADEAEMQYINSILAVANKALDEQKTNVKNASDEMLARKNELLQKQKEGSLTYKELEALDKINKEYPGLTSSDEKLQTLNNTINNKNLGNDIRSLRARADAAAAHVLSSYDFYTAAETLALKDAKMTLKENPYRLATLTADLSLRNSTEMARINYENKMNEMIAKNGLDMKRDQFKYLLELGAYDDSLLNPGATPGGPNLNGRPVEGVPGTSVKVADEENMSAVYDVNKQVATTLESNYIDNMSNFLLELYRTAENSKSPGGKNAINKIFNNTLGQKGSPYTNSVDGVQKLLQDMRSMPSMIETYYNKALEETTKQCDTCDTQWSKTFMEQKYPIEVLNKIDDQKKAALAVNYKVKDDIKAIVESVGKQRADNYISGGNPYADSDLMLNNGYLTDLNDFTEKYIQRHRLEDRYQIEESGFEESTGWGYEEKPKNDIRIDAQRAFQALTDKIFVDYNTASSRDIPLDQGFGLEGGGTLSGKTIVIDVDGSKTLSGPTRLAKQELTALNDMSAMIGNKNFEVGFGAPVKDNVGGDKKQAAIKNALAILAGDLTKRWKKDDKKRPDFEYGSSKIALNNKEMSGKIIKFKGDYLKKMVGTEKSPGPLYAYADKLGEGIFLAYNRTAIQLPSDLASQSTDLDYIARFDPKGIKITVPNAGTLYIKTDPTTGVTRVDGFYKMYVNGEIIDNSYTETLDPSDDLASKRDELMNKLMERKLSNDSLDQAAINLNKAGVKVKTLVPKDSTNNQ